MSLNNLNCLNNNHDPGKLSMGEKKEAEENITNLISKSWNALSEQNLEEFEQCITNDWNLYTVLGNKMRAEQLFDIHRKHIKNFYLKITNLDVHVYDGIAWATYDGNATGIRNGEDFSGNFIYTGIFVFESGRWKITHVQESKVQ